MFLKKEAGGKQVSRTDAPSCSLVIYESSLPHRMTDKQQQMQDDHQGNDAKLRLHVAFGAFRPTPGADRVTKGKKDKPVWGQMKKCAGGTSDNRYWVHSSVRGLLIKHRVELVPQSCPALQPHGL